MVAYLGVLYIEVCYFHRLKETIHFDSFRFKLRYNLIVADIIFIVLYDTDCLECLFPASKLSLKTLHKYKVRHNIK